MQTDYNLIVGVVGIVIGAIFGAFFTWWSISQSRRIARESGAFKKAAPSIYFLKKDLSSRQRR
jgi:ABC-type lipoprotein release transport system permease subunit